MTFTYTYKTPDARRHEATIEADSRDAAFSTLRAQGIRPIKVVAADGSKANGTILVRGVRKRVVSCLVLVAILVTGLLVFTTTSKLDNSITRKLNNVPNALPRHQIYGDPAIVEAINHGKTAAYLSRPGDRYLAYFAQPGRIACPAHLLIENDPVKTRLILGTNEVAEIAAAASSLVIISEKDPREVRELKQIVNGLHAEMADYLANGKGTIRSYWRRLQERTRQEIQIFERTKRELADQTDPILYESRNDSLRDLGLPTIPLPEE